MPSLPPSPAEPPRHLWYRAIVRFALQTAILLVLYVLSIGPMFWYWFEAIHGDGSKYIAAFYTPLLYACEIDPIRDFVNWYIDLWIL